MEAGISEAWSPLTLVIFNVGFLALAYPAGALSDRASPRLILLAGMAALVVTDLILGFGTGLPLLILGVLLWGAHMALTQGIFARMIADSAPEHLRASSFGAFYFASGIATLLANLAAGLLWDRDGSQATFIAGAGAASVAMMMLTLLPEQRRV
jgi:MFS family permease